MSRESELSILQDMKQKILSIYEIIDRCKNAQREYAQLQAERENNTRPALNLPRPNNKSTLEKKYSDLWRDRYLKNRFVKPLLIVVFTLLMLGYAALLWFDGFTGTGYLITQEQFNAIDFDFDLSNSVLYTYWIIFPLSLVALSIRFFYWEDVGPFQTLIWGCVGLFFAGMSLVSANSFIPLLPLIPFVLTMVLGIIIPKIREVKSKHPVFNARQKKELAKAEQQDNEIIADNNRKNEQADREWAEKRAKRLPELDREQSRIAKQFEQLKTELDEENAALEAMQGVGRDEKQLDIIDSLIYFIDTCRADSIKEALHEYDKMVANQQLLELQRQRNKLEEQRIANEAADRKKQLRLLEQQEAARTIEANDSARARQEMISAVRSMEWYQWAEFNGLNK